MRVIVAVIVAALAACKGKSESTSGSAAPPVVAATRDAAAPALDAAVAAADAVAAGSGDGSDSDPDMKILDTESIGGLRPGSTEEQTITILGAPKSRSKPVLEGATGAYVSGWTWSNATIDMTADKTKGPWVARLVTVTALPFETKQHVHVGSSRKDVEKAYTRSPDDDTVKSIAIGPFAF